MAVSEFKLKAVLEKLLQLEQKRLELKLVEARTIKAQNEALKEALEPSPGSKM